MAAGSFRFDRFRLDPDDRRLTRDGARVELNARYLDALSLLVREQGRLVSKDRFLDEVWRGVPVWEHAGILCTGEVYKTYLKLTFARGAALDDPSGLFNASLEGNARRAIDIPESAALDEAAFKALIRSAVALNTTKRTRG